MPDGREIHYGYDRNGNLTSLIPPGQPAHLFDYTALDQEKDYTPPSVDTSDPATPVRTIHRCLFVRMSQATLAGALASMSRDHASESLLALGVKFSVSVSPDELRGRGTDPGTKAVRARELGVGSF